METVTTTGIEMAKKQATKVEKEHMQRVASLGCIICGQPAEIHHLTGSGMGLRSNHFTIIPLCFDHHSAQSRLPFGYAAHKGTKSFEQRFGTQLELLTKTQELLLMRYGEYRDTQGRLLKGEIV